LVSVTQHFLLYIIKNQKKKIEKKKQKQ